MRFLRNRWFVSALALAALPFDLQAGQQVFVQKISVSASNPPVFEIQTSAAVTPRTQVISNPERLVIDIPDSTPAPSLRGLNVERGEVKRVRVGLLSAVPPTTRIVLDLNAAQWYRLLPTASGFSVRLGTVNSNVQDGDDTAPTVGWVSANLPVNRVREHPDPFVIKRTSTRSKAMATTDLRVLFAKGLLEIHARDSSLSEVLFQIEQQTGAEIEIPAGTEQDRVAGDFGPAAASEVIGQLLNGSDLNFVVVGSQADPNLPHRVVLSRKSSAGITPAASYTPPATPNNVVPSNAGDIRADMAADMENTPPQEGSDNILPPQEQPPQQPGTDVPPDQNPQPQN